MKIGLARRHYSATGGAEAYLKRFAETLGAAGHSSVLFATADWPESDWPHGQRITLPGRTPGEFADSLAAAHPREHCDFLFSLERVWRCDAFRAGDGVHRAWLARRERQESALATWFRRFRASHRELLALENSLFGEGGAARVIANSHMVKREIIEHFRYPEERIHVVYNGIPPAPSFPTHQMLRAQTRQRLGFGAEDFLVLFAGSGWERKGLRHAVRGIDCVPGNMTLLVAGRGKKRECPPSPRVRLLGPTRGLSEVLAAADLFLLPTLYDPFSNACLEAASYGLPVITTVNNGFAELITPGLTGEILPSANDEAAIAAAVEKWRDPALRTSAQAALATLAGPLTLEANLAATLAAFSAKAPNSQSEGLRIKK